MDLQSIEDTKHPAVRRVADVMRSTASRPRTLLIDDEENIRQAVAAGVAIDSLYATPSVDGARELQSLTGAPLYLLGEGVMKGLFRNEKRARIFALARAPKLATWNDLSRQSGDLVVLDGVRIAGNIGAIIRSACAFNASGLVLLDSGLSSVWDRRIVRASRGLAFSIPIVLSTAHDLNAFLRSEKIPVASLAAHGETTLTELGNKEERLALLLGSERDGASATMEQVADWRCSVPMEPGVESLNVSVAAGIALYERYRRVE